MAPSYKLYGGFTVQDAFDAAGAPNYGVRYRDSEPPVSFFIKPPAGSVAAFSTLGGQKPFRFVENPTDEREGVHWWAAEIQRVCDELRRNLPDVCSSIVKPQSYWDLYRYFDAHDIYYRGAQNLWNVINTLDFENDYARTLVAKEREMQIRRYMSLFEFLADEIVQKPEMQTKLLAWNKETERDILKVFTSYDLQSFEGHEKYPEHILDAIRTIFKRHHVNLRNGLPFARGLASAHNGTSTVTVPEQLAAMKRDLKRSDGVDDPFLEKFDIPNRIVDGIVIVDGTSQTAARRARFDAKVAAANVLTRQRDNGTNTSLRSSETSIESVGPLPNDAVVKQKKHHRPTLERCLSAPIVGGDPASLASHLATEEARVYPGDGHKVERKLTGCQKPDDPEESTGSGPNTENTSQGTMPTTDGHVQPVASAMNQAQPPIQSRGAGETSPRQHSLAQHRSALPVNNIPPVPMVPVQPYYVQGPQGPVPYGTFTNQIPVYALSRQHIGGIPSTVPPLPCPHPVQMQTSNGGYAVNSTPTRPPTESREQFFRQQNINPRAKDFNQGKWQHVGTNDIHGPKVVFRKESGHSQSGTNYPVAQAPQNYQAGQGGFDGTEKRRSTASTTGSYQRFSNTHQQQYNNPNSRPRTDKRASSSWRNSEGPASLAQSPNRYGCVNHGKSSNKFTRFDPCPCKRCHEKDSSIYVGRFKDDLSRVMGAMDLVRQNFARFGDIQAIDLLPDNRSLFVKFTTPQAAVAAVQEKGSCAQIAHLGSTRLYAKFRMGSQYFIPLPHTWNEVTYNANVQDQRISSPGHQATPTLPMNTINNPNPDPNSFRQQDPSPEKQSVSPGSAVPEGQSPDASIDVAKKYAMDLLDRRNKQTGFGKHEVEQPLHSEATGPVPPPHVNGLHVTSDHQRHNSHPTEVIHHGAPQELGTDVVEADYKGARLPSGSDQDLPNNPLSPTHNLAPESVSSSSARDAQTQSSEKTGQVSISKETCIDYGTVRVRPEGARYEGFPPDWTQEPTPSHSIEEQGNLSQTSPAQVTSASDVEQRDKGKQTTEQDSGDIVAQLQNVDSKDDYDVHHSDTDTHMKRKADEASNGSGEPSQLSPKHNNAKIAPLDETLEKPPSSQTDLQDKEHVRDTSCGSNSKDNDNDNGSNKSQTDDNTLAATQHEAPAFKPALDASQLPPYPGQTGPSTEPQAALPHHPSPRSNAVTAATLPVHGTPQSHKPEPFPVYRDLMSGPQLPLRGHKGRGTQLGHNRYILSNASTIIQDPNWRINETALGAKRFVPFPPNPGPGFLVPMPPPQTSMSRKLFDWRPSMPTPDHILSATQDPRIKGPLPTQEEIFAATTTMPIGARCPQPEIQKSTAAPSSNEGSQKDSNKDAGCEDEAAPPVAADKDDTENTKTKQGTKKANRKAKNKKGPRDTRKNTTQTLPDQMEGLKTEHKAEKNVELNAERDQGEPKEMDVNDKGKGKGKENQTITDPKRPESRTSLRTDKTSGRTTPIPTPTSTSTIAPSPGESSKVNPRKSKTQEAPAKSAAADADTDADADATHPPPAAKPTNNKKNNGGKKGHKKKKSSKSSQGSSRPRSRAQTPPNPNPGPEPKPEARPQSPKAQAPSPASSSSPKPVTVDVTTTTTTATAAAPAQPSPDNDEDKKGHKKKNSSQGSSRARSWASTLHNPNSAPEPEPKLQPQSLSQSPKARVPTPEVSPKTVDTATATATATAAAATKPSPDSKNNSSKKGHKKKKSSQGSSRSHHPQSRAATPPGPKLDPEPQPQPQPRPLRAQAPAPSATSGGDAQPQPQPQPQPKAKTKPVVPKLAPIPLRMPPWRGIKKTDTTTTTK